MRTYQLQDDGLDTFDANTTLGFDDDQRDYGIAARMVRMLNCTRTVLLTNNRAKLYGFTKTGIEIASRMPINADNCRYVTAKASACQTPVRSSDGLAGRSVLARRVVQFEPYARPVTRLLV